MKSIFFLFGLSLLLIFSCEKAGPTESINKPLSPEIINSIIKLGLSPEGAYKVEGGFVVEKDIFVSHEELNFIPPTTIPTLEQRQYRTTNIVNVPKYGTRTISIIINPNSPRIYITAVDTAIRRFNLLYLNLIFQRVNGPSINNIFNQISIVFRPIIDNDATIRARAGFPSIIGPFSQIILSTNNLDGENIQSIASTIAHEIGHCIGFRHTDFYNRSISCGGNAQNEGAGTNGSILIPGTPATATNAARSWMLACTDGGNRPFNRDDIIALRTLYCCRPVPPRIR